MVVCTYACTFVCMYIRVKPFHYRPGQALRLQEVEASRSSRQSAHEGGMVVSFTHWPLLPPGDMYVCMYICMHVCVYMYVCMYVCMYVAHAVVN